MSDATVTFKKCGSGQWRGTTAAGRVYWITRTHGSHWELRCAENEDEDERHNEILADGRLADCEREARQVERERIADEAGPATGWAIAEHVWNAGRRFGSGRP